MKKEHFEGFVKGFGLTNLDWETYQLLHDIEEESYYSMDELVEKLNDFAWNSPIEPSKFFAYLRVMDTDEYLEIKYMQSCYAGHDPELLDEILQNGLEETKLKVESEYREWCANDLFE